MIYLNHGATFILDDLVLTPFEFDHFQNMSSGGIGPNLILTLCLKHSKAFYSDLWQPVALLDH